MKGQMMLLFLLILSIAILLVMWILMAQISEWNLFKIEKAIKLFMDTDERGRELMSLLGIKEGHTYKRVMEKIYEGTSDNALLEFRDALSKENFQNYYRLSVGGKIFLESPMSRPKHLFEYDMDIPVPGAGRSGVIKEKVILEVQ